MELTNVVVCYGGHWEQINGNFDYVPFDCSRRGVCLDTSFSYSQLVTYISNVFNLRNISGLSYKTSSDMYPVDIFDDYDINIFLK